MQKPRVRTPAWIEALRPHHSIKNILIFVPLLVGHAFGDVEKIVAAGLGFFILCVLTSASYLINDIADLDADRRHPLKRRRPFASGRLTATFGKVAAPIMIVGALAAAYALAPRFAATLLAYLALTIAYSFSLKRLPLLDVFIVSGLFTLRIVMGTEVIGLEHSPWLLSFSLAFFLSLALAKRHAELVRAALTKTAEIAGRGYRSDDWPLTLTFGIGSGLASVVIMLLYMANDAAPSGFYHHTAWLYAVPVAVSAWLMRIWLLSHRQELNEDPVMFALEDRVSLALGLAVAVAFYLAL